MDVFGLLGFTFGITAFSFAIISWAQVSKLECEMKKLREQIVESGIKIDQDA